MLFNDHKLNIKKNKKWEQLNKAKYDFINYNQYLKNTVIQKISKLTDFDLISNLINKIEEAYKINENINNISELNLFKYRNNLTKNINLFDTNYIDSYKNKKKKLNKIKNEIIKINLQVKEFNDNDETNVEENNDKKISNISNSNLLDYSIVVSNKKKE